METYIKPIGKNLLLYVEDDGSFVRFYIRSLDPYFSLMAMSGSCKYHGGTKKFNFNMPVGGELISIGPMLYIQKSGPVSVTVNVSAGNTPSGIPTTTIGGSTTFTVDINRGSGKPIPPVVLSLHMISATTCRVRFQWRGSGDAMIKQYDLRWRTSLTAGGTLVSKIGTSGTYDLTGLKPNTIYYISVRAVNKKNEIGDWSQPDAGILTTGGAKIFVGNEWRNAIPYVKVNGAWKRAQAYVKVNGAWKRT